MRLPQNEFSLYFFWIIFIYIIWHFIKSARFTSKVDIINDSLVDKINKKSEENSDNEINYTPLKTREAITKGHKLYHNNDWNIILKASKVWYIFTIAFIFSFSQMVSLSYDWELKFSDFLDIDDILSHFKLQALNWNWFLAVFIFLFCLYFIFIHASFYKSIVFDFNKWFLYPIKYRDNFHQINSDEKYKKWVVWLKDIYALQIVSKARHNPYSYPKDYRKNLVLKDWTKRGILDFIYTYQLNLVLKDWNRIFITDNPSLSDINKDAEILNKKLWVKVLDLRTLNTDEIKGEFIK